MGRGRQKAKQTKVARKLKYFSPNTDLDALQRELTSSSSETPDHDAYSQYVADDDENDEEDPYSEYAAKYGDSYFEDDDEGDTQDEDLTDPSSDDVAPRGYTDLA